MCALRTAGGRGFRGWEGVQGVGGGLDGGLRGGGVDPSSPPWPETLYHRDDALLHIACVLLIWAAPSRVSFPDSSRSGMDESL